LSSGCCRPAATNFLPETSCLSPLIYKRFNDALSRVRLSLRATLDYHLCAEDGSEQLGRKYQQLLVTTDRDRSVLRNQQRAAQPGLLVYPYFLPENIPNSTSV